MTTNDLVNIIEAMPDIRIIDMVAANKRKAIQQLVPVALDEVVVSYDWDFATDVADKDTVADQAEYTLEGNDDDCRDIINVRYGTTSDGFVLLDKKRPVDMVISDFLMPDMNGLEFLSEVKNLCPDTVRILLTGYADRDNAIRAINEIGLFQYLEKPWDNDHLILIIKRV